MTFFITGLPRSRTAWFSVATGAEHESITRANDYRHWPSCGVSDSGAGLWLKEIIELHQPRTLLIERPLADVVRSCERLFGSVDHEALRDRLLTLRTSLGYDHELIKRVRYHELNDIRALEGCFDWLGVKVTNLAQLMHMRIESDLGWNFAEYERAA